MNPYRILILIGTVIILVLFIVGNNNSTAPTNNKVIRVAGDNNFPPFEYTTESGSFTGFNIDVMNAISIETGVKIEFYPKPWNEAIVALQNGEVDAIQGMKYSTSRDQNFDFSEPFFTSSQGIFVLKDNLYIFDIKDLNGLKVSLQRGDIANDVLSQLERAEFFTTESHEEAVDLLLQGKVDAFVGNRITGQYFVQKQNKQSLIKIVGEPINPTDYGVAVLPHNNALLEEINLGISRIKKNGTYEKINTKWFGEYITDTVPRLQQVLLYLKVGLGITFLIFLIVLWWNWILKKEVNKRTKKIQENLQFQQQLVESTYSFLITITKSGHISMINKKAIDYLKVRGDSIGEHISVTKITEMVPIQEIETVLHTGKKILQRENTWNNKTFKDKKTRVLTYHIFPIISSGEISGAIINLNDITDQREIEKRLEHEDRLRSLGQVMLGIAHEIRNPLMSLLTYTNLLPKKINNPEFRKFFIEHVPREINRLNHLVSDLLEYARPKKPEPIYFSVYPLIETLLQFFDQKIKEKNLVINIHVDHSLKAYADSYQIKQVLINIILNAFEATDQNGTIIIKAYSKENMTVIEIEDSGHGLSAEEIDKIFEPFYSSKSDGTGLGLSISFQLIKENQGYIEMSSSQGEGSTMSIQLPAKGMIGYEKPSSY